MTPIGRHLLVRGRVQGVGFRAWACSIASKLGLVGWVRNLRNGAVEIEVAGPEAAVAAFIEACRSGPTLARVDSLDISDVAAPAGPGFVQRPTA